jgi:ADP-ribose pyrophosphatase
MKPEKISTESIYEGKIFDVSLDRVREGEIEYEREIILHAGSLEKDESPEIGAHRELEEEIGVTAGKLEKLSEFFVSPGFLSEKMFVFLATDLSETTQNLEDDELIEIEKFTFEQAFEMIRKNEIEDAKTMIGLILAGAKLGFNF